MHPKRFYSIPSGGDQTHPNESPSYKRGNAANYSLFRSRNRTSDPQTLNPKPCNGLNVNSLKANPDVPEPPNPEASPNPEP